MASCIDNTKKLGTPGYLSLPGSHYYFRLGASVAVGKAQAC